MKQPLHFLCIHGTESFQSSSRPLREPHMLQSANCNTIQPTLVDTKTCHTGSYPEPIQNSAITIHFLRMQSDTFSEDSYHSQVDPPEKFSQSTCNCIFLFPTCPHRTNLHDKALLTITTSKTWHSSFFNSICFRHSWIERIFLQNSQLRFLSLCTVRAGLVWRLYRTNKSESPVPDLNANTLFVRSLRFYTLHCPLCFICFWNKYSSNMPTKRADTPESSSLLDCYALLTDRIFRNKTVFPSSDSVHSSSTVWPWRWRW